MSNPTEAPKETSAPDLSADVTVSANSTVQLEQPDNRMVEKQDQANRIVQNAVSVALEAPSPVTPATPVVMASPMLPQQPAAHFQVVSQVASNAATQATQIQAPVSVQQTQQSVQMATVSQTTGQQQAFHQLTTAQGATHQTIQYGATPSIMTQTAEQQTVHLQTTQAVMTHGTGQQTIQLGLGQGLLTHGVSQQTIQGLVAQGSSVYGGAQIICSPDPSNNAQMESATVACQQYLTSAGLAGQQFMPVPQLQVIQTAPNQFIQQQIMYQNMPLPTAIHAVQNQSIGSQIATQCRPNSTESKTSSILPAGQQQNVAIRIAVSNSYAIPSQTGVTKGMATVMPQQTSIFGGKQVVQKQQASPLVFGMQQMQQPTILQSVRPAGSISFSPVQQAQIISSPTQFRFAAAPNFIGNTAQMIGQNQTLVNFGQFQTVPIVQPLLASQGPTILSSQPLYIRAAEPVQPLQQSILSGVQTVTPTRHVANIAPQAIRPTTPQIQSRRGVQTQASSSSSTHSQTAASSSKSSGAAPPPKSSAKSPASTRATPVAKPSAAASSAATAVARAPTQSIALPHPGASCAPVATVAAQSKPQVSCKIEDPGKAEDKSAAAVAGVETRDEAAPEDTAEKTAVPNARLKEEAVSPCVRSVAAVLPTSVNKTFTELKVKTDDVAKPLDDVATPRVKSGAEKENQPSSKREKSHKKTKPKVLTHIIEGFIIQEAMEPFPVNRSSLVSQFLSPNLALPDEKNALPLTTQFDDDSEDEEEKEQEEENNESPNKKARTEPEPASEAIEQVAEKLGEVEQTEEPCMTPVAQDLSPVPGSARLTCEFCGKSDFIQNFARSKRFCSVTCSKRFSAYSQRKQSENGGAGKGGGGGGIPAVKGLKRTIQQLATSGCVDQSGFSGTSFSNAGGTGLVGSIVTPFQASNSAECSSDTDKSTVANGKMGENSIPCSPAELERTDRMDIDEFGDVLIPANKHLSQWGVHDVYNFIRTLPSCGMYADEFRAQEIDGQALMLLKEDHLMTTLNVKLGPALKICAKINMLKN